MYDIFVFEEYRELLKVALKSMPRNGFGQLSKLAKHIGVNSGFLSQILKEDKTFSPEQALGVTEFLQLNEREREYFLLLVNYDRAGSKELKNYLLKNIRAKQSEYQQLKNRVKIDTKLSESTQAIFYSDWVYSAVRQASAIPNLSRPNVIADFLSVPTKRVLEVIEFLLSTGLCVSENGELKIGQRRTHLDESSPLKKNHHQNWRTKALELVFDSWDLKLHYSSPMTISKQDAKTVKKIILSMIDQVNQVADQSHSEELVCFNVDWFRVNKL
jgi:uncharacterized protein (TIGR02147 family)